MPEKKPHILLLIDDEHRPDVMPIEGNSHIQTPTLDRFIKPGYIFSQRLHPIADMRAGAAKFPLRSVSPQYRSRR
jgi:hypothetical protein